MQAVGAAGELTARVAEQRAAAEAAEERATAARAAAEEAANRAEGWEKEAREQKAATAAAEEALNKQRDELERLRAAVEAAARRPAPAPVHRPPQPAGMAGQVMAGAAARVQGDAQRRAQFAAGSQARRER